ncbi:MAG: cytochrome b N-terminal domain-containing protein [Nitrososphaerales archaeon]|nr:cytochrome b N-terminal domain-containing protein [Nitrososphaerales archaeon]
MKGTAWLRDRLGLGIFLDHMIPKHANSPTYVIGGSVVVLGIAQGITGVLLQQFYHPMPDQNAAYASVQFITGDALWNFVRNMHYWGAQLLLILVILHMMRVYVSAAYKKPREMLWVAGAGLLVATWLLLFTGSVLRWDQEAVEALGHNLELTAFAGVLGYWFDPSFAPNVPILIRINSAHVTILPLIALGLVGVHVYLIRVLGISGAGRDSETQEPQVPFSTHITRMTIYGLLAIVLVAVVSVAINAPLTTLGNPGIEISKPDWYLLWVYTIENYWGLQAVPYVLTPALILILIAPVLDRGSETSPRKRKLMVGLFIIAIALFAALTIGAALLPPQSHLG